MFTINDAASLRTAVELASSMPESDDRTRAARRVVMRRARELGCQHLVPTQWLRPRGSTGTSSSDVVAQANSVFAQKSERSSLSDEVLRSAYLRGVRDYTMTSPHSRPPLPRDAVAQARVNSLIRLAAGDDTARSDDADLITSEGRTS